MRERKEHENPPNICHTGHGSVGCCVDKQLACLRRPLCVLFLFCFLLSLYSIQPIHLVRALFSSGVRNRLPCFRFMNAHVVTVVNPTAVNFYFSLSLSLGALCFLFWAQNDTTSVDSLKQSGWKDPAREIV